MKNLLWLLLFAPLAYGQVSSPGVIYQANAPSGACATAPPIRVVDSTGTIYTCDSGTWAAQGGGSGGGVSSVTGTTNQIDSTGGTTPVISVDDAFVFPGTAKGKVINGVSYSINYSGALAERVNACVTDAETLANGNTSGVCDASGESGTTTTDEQITVGNSAGTEPVTLILPAKGGWIGGMTGGTSSTLVQYGGTSIIGSSPASGISSEFVIGATNTSLLDYVYESITSGNPYFHASGFAVINNNGGPFTGHATASGIGALLSGSADVSSWENMVFLDNQDTYAVEAAALCCSATMRNVAINGNYVSTPLLILTNTTAGVVSLNIVDSSIGHPGPTLPIVSCSDTSTSHSSTVNLNNIYSETSNSDTTTALYQVSGCGAVTLSNINFRSQVASSTATGITVSNTVNTMLSASNISFTNGAGSFETFPHAAIANSFNSQTILTDAQGNLAHSDNGTTYNNMRFSDFAAGIAIGNSNALPATTSGTSNLAIGHTVLEDLTTGSDDVAIGNASCAVLTTASFDVCVGVNAGTNSGTMVTNADSTFVGYDANASANALTNDLVLGYEAQATVSNQAVIGNASVTSTLLRGTLHSTGTTPVASAGTITGSNAGGFIAGLSAATTVTITFANSGWSTWSSCTANTNVSATQPYISAISDTAVTFTFASLTGTLYYQCNGN